MEKTIFYSWYILDQLFIESLIKKSCFRNVTCALFLEKVSPVLKVAQIINTLFSNMSYSLGGTHRGGGNLQKY